MQLVASPVDGKSPGVVVISSSGDAAPTELPIGAGGLPLVAMQYTRLSLRVRCKTDPGGVAVTYRYLPTYQRRDVAEASHTIVGFDGVRGRRLFVSNGKVSEEPPPRGCAVM
jgi:hypothetical protein